MQEKEAEDKRLREEEERLRREKEETERKNKVSSSSRIRTVRYLPDTLIQVSLGGDSGALLILCTYLPTYRYWYIHIY